MICAVKPIRRDSLAKRFGCFTQQPCQPRFSIFLLRLPEVFDLANFSPGKFITCNVAILILANTGLVCLCRLPKTRSQFESAQAMANLRTMPPAFTTGLGPAEKK